MKGKIAGYVTVGTNDLNKAKEFYDGLLGELGATSFGPNERSFFWSIEGGETTFAVFIPYDGNEATVGNGNMTGFAMDSREQVDAMHAKALELGASDEGEMINEGEDIKIEPEFYLNKDGVVKSLSV